MAGKRLPLLATGLAGGLLSGLFGAGGGLAVVPLLGRAGLEARRAHATSLAVTLPLAAASGLFYLSLGAVEPGQALPYLPLGLAHVGNASHVDVGIVVKYVDSACGGHQKRGNRREED